MPIETLIALSLFFVFGAIFGSFANVVIYRMPAGESVVSPGSRCSKCKKPIAWYLNIPILAWFILRGKCANCGQKYSFRYPFVELLMGVLFAATFYVTGWSWTLVEYIPFVFSLVVCTFIDFDHMILPDQFTLSGIVLGLLGGLFNPERDFLSSFLGVVVGGGFLWAIAYLYYVVRKRDGMGGGDIKLLAWIGAVLGWQAIIVVVLVSTAVGSIVGIGFALREKNGLAKAIPFGPYLVLGALIYIFFDGAGWGKWYLSLYGL